MFKKIPSNSNYCCYCGTRLKQKPTLDNRILLKQNKPNDISKFSIIERDRNYSITGGRIVKFNRCNMHVDDFKSIFGKYLRDKFYFKRIFADVTLKNIDLGYSGVLYQNKVEIWLVDECLLKLDENDIELYNEYKTTNYEGTTYWTRDESFCQKYYQRNGYSLTSHNYKTILTLKTSPIYISLNAISILICGVNIRIGNSYKELYGYLEKENKIIW